MSPDAESMLNMLGLSFSTSNELWVRLTRHWKQYLLHHLQEAEASGASTSLPEEAVSKVGTLVVASTHYVHLTCCQKIYTLLLSLSFC
jgi:hypothetical protein